MFFPGIIQRSYKPINSVIIFVHGSGGNFFKENYLEDMSKDLNYYWYDFLTFNNRWSEQFLRLHRKNSWISEVIKAGNIYENFDESIYDLIAAINYAKEIWYNDIILIWQSLGTLKVQYYCEQIWDIKKIILLSPLDMINRFRSRVKEKYDKLINKSKKLISEWKPYEMVTNEFSALKIASTMAIGCKADLFKLEENRNITKPLNYDGYVSIIAGTNEHVYNGWSMEYVKDRFEKRFKNAKLQFYTIPNSTHDYSEHEKEISKLIIDSIRNMKD